MKKIIFLTNYFPKLPEFENFGTWAFDQAKAISKENKVQVITFVPYFPGILGKLNEKLARWKNIYNKFKYSENLNIEYVRINPFLYKYFKKLKTNPDIFSLIFYYRLSGIIRTFAPDLIIANHVMMEGLIANVFNRKKNIPYICFEHSPDDFFPLNSKHYSAYKKVVGNSLKFINVSEYSYSIIEDVYHFNENKNYVLYNYSQDAVKFRNSSIMKAYGLDEKKKYIIEVANFEKRKNHLKILEIYRNIRPDHPDWNVVFIGSHDETLFELEKFINTNNLPEAVHIFRDMKHSDVLCILNYMHIFVLPSDREMFSVSVLEALSAGLPVISTIHNGLVDPVFADSSVININPGNNEEITRNLEIFMTDEKLRKQTGKNNRSLYDKHFTDTLYIKNINSLINSL
jgi:glycosyltransferase involved in cell wall biosynthesis